MPKNRFFLPLVALICACDDLAFTVPGAEEILGDEDGDGWIVCPSPQMTACDCDDLDEDVNPDAVDFPNLEDENCDGIRLDDQDGDGFLAAYTEDGQQDTSSSGEWERDCDDHNPQINPSAAEVCDGDDNDCDGFEDVIYDGDGDAVFLDTDDDGYCPGEGDGFDCDDQRPEVNPAAEEVCNGIDDDCDELIDEDLDLDGDGLCNVAGCDAVESCPESDCDDSNASISPFVEEVCGDTIDNDCDGQIDEAIFRDGVEYKSLQLAIEEASNGDTILVAACTLKLEAPLIIPAMPLTIRCLSQDSKAILDGGGDGPVVTFEAFADSDTVLEGFEIRGGEATHGGGIYLERGSPTLRRVTVSNNTADEGGGLYVQGDCSPMLMDVSISNNTATSKGGGVFASAGLFAPDIASLTISDNAASLQGGGILVSGTSQALLSHTTIELNVSHQGGGVSVEKGAYLEAIDVTFRGNRGDGASGAKGGGLMATGSSVIISDGLFDDNSTGVGNQGNGGAIYVDGLGTLTISNALIVESAAPVSGGGLYLTSAASVLRNVAFIGNEALFSGGAVFQSGSVLIAQNVIFGGNEAPNGAGIYATAESELTLVNAVFRYNDAFNSGGGLEIVSSTLNTRSVVFQENEQKSQIGDAICSNLRCDGAEIATFCTFAWCSSGASGVSGTTAEVIQESTTFVLDAPPDAGLGDWMNERLYHIEAGAVPANACGEQLLFLDPSGESPSNDPATDAGAFGGPYADNWDLDRDGRLAWFWPGECSSETTYDCADFPALSK